MRFFLHQIVIVLLLGVFCCTGGQSTLAAEKSAAQKKAEYRAKVREEAKEKALREARESVMGVTPAMVQNAIAGGIEFLKSTQGKSGGWKEEDLDAVRRLHREAQWFFDYCYVENSEGAHNSELSMSCLDIAEAKIDEAMVLLAK